MAMNSASKTVRAQTVTDRGDTPATPRLDTSASATAARVVVLLLFAKWHRCRSAAKLLIGDVAANIAKRPEWVKRPQY